MVMMPTQQNVVAPYQQKGSTIDHDMITTINTDTSQARLGGTHKKGALSQQQPAAPNSARISVNRAGA
jgi:hypothetical protein